MLLKDFEEILHMKSEIKLLRKRLEKACEDPNFAADYAKDYSTGFERIISIAGYPLKDLDKTKKIYDMLRKRLDKMEDMILKAEEFINSIPDNESIIRTLLTLKYIEDMTWDEAAKQVYKKMSGDAARKQVIRYFDKT